MTEVLVSVLICDTVFCVLRACSKTFNDAGVRWYIRFTALIRDVLLFIKDEQADKGFVADKEADNDIVKGCFRCVKHRPSTVFRTAAVVSTNVKDNVRSSVEMQTLDAPSVTEKVIKLPQETLFGDDTLCHVVTPLKT